MAGTKISETKSTGGKPQKTIKQATALSADDLGKVSGGINPQPLPPGKTRVSQ